MTALALRTFSTHLLNTALLVLLVTADRLEATGAHATLAILLTAHRLPPTAYRLPPTAPVSYMPNAS